MVAGRRDARDGKCLQSLKVVERWTYGEASGVELLNRANPLGALLEDEVEASIPSRLRGRCEFRKVERRPTG